MPTELDKLAGPDGGNQGMRLARFWLDQITAVKDNSQMKQWGKRGEAVVKRYRDERSRSDEDGQRRYNSLWANVEALKPALYGKTPLPVAERRFKDKDPTGRAAAQILERALRNEIEICGFNEALQQAVSDYLLPGRGTVWVRYEPEIEESVSLPPDPQTDMRDAQGGLPGKAPAPEDQDNTEITPKGRLRPRLTDKEPDTDDEGDEDKNTTNDAASEELEKLQSTGDRIVRESTPVDFVEWPNFIAMPVRARSWAEVTAVAKMVYLSRDQAKKRFGKAIGGKLPLEKDDRGSSTQNTTLQGGDDDKCRVYEIWSKDDRTVYWVCMGYDYLCDRKEDPLTLENFFPTPKPLFANSTNNTLIPVPDYIQYQDQAIQIDELTQRIAMLTKACKVAGVYNASAKDVQRMFSESVENELIPVDDWAAFADKGGVQGVISFLPIEVIKNVINELMMVKEKQIQEMDRLTGINDIMRGTSDARETLGGVRLKTNNTGTRLTQRQNEVARFARDTVRIMADIMSQHFSPQSLIEVSGALYEEGLGPDDMPSMSMLSGGEPSSQPQLGGPQPAASKPPMPMPMPGAGAGASPGQPPGQGPQMVPQAQPPVGPGQGGPPMMPPPQGQPAMPPLGPQPLQPSSNVIPFRPPQGGPPPPAGMPPGGPQGLTGQVLPPLPPEMAGKLQALQRIMGAVQLLRNERLRGFRVDIEVDSTIYPDAAQEKADRTEFITRVTQYLQQSMAMGAQLPEITPLLGKLLLFGVRGYRIGRDLEMAIEEFSDQAMVAAQRHQQQQASQPNPIQAKLQIEQSKASAQVEAIKAKTQSEANSAQAEVQRQQIENQGEAQNSQADLAAKQIDLQMRQIEKQIAELHAQVEMMKAQQVAAQPPTPQVQGNA